MNPSEARIVLTGANGGIGRETAAAFIGAGASVLLVGRSAAQLSALSRSIQATATGNAGRVAWQVADLGKPTHVDELVSVAAEWRCNVLVHAAGVPCFGALETVDAETMRPRPRHQPSRADAADPSPAAASARAGAGADDLPRLGARAHRPARLLRLQRQQVRVARLCRSLRRELSGTGIRVQYVGPRSTRTSFNDAAVEAYNAATGTAMDSPSRVAEALLRSLQDEAAERFIGFPERLAVRINGAVPTLLDGSFDKHRRSVPPPSGEGALSTQRSERPGVSSPIESSGVPR
jgi:short-subunit dehydrogenase